MNEGARAASATDGHIPRGCSARFFVPRDTRDTFRPESTLATLAASGRCSGTRRGSPAGGCGLQARSRQKGLRDRTCAAIGESPVRTSAASPENPGWRQPRLPSNLTRPAFGLGLRGPLCRH
jgi:hypothetical protein